MLVSTVLPDAERLEAVQCALLMMPDENREALLTLLTFLARVADHADLNQVKGNIPGIRG